MHVFCRAYLGGGCIRWKPPPAYQAAAPAVAALTWTGCYFGGHGGGLLVRDDSTFVGPNGSGSLTIGTSLGGHDATGRLAGIQIGCNYQVGNWVFGAQGGFAWADAWGSHPDPFFLTTDSSRTRQLMETTWRAGYTWDRFFGYAKAGGGWERIYYTMDALPNTDDGGGSRETGGWTVGIGVEYAVTAWLSAFIEYDHFDFGTVTQTFVNRSGTFVAIENIRDTKDLLKVGLNLRF